MNIQFYVCNSNYHCYQITKPLLERKRRARINRCLDELKDLMFTALEVSKHLNKTFRNEFTKECIGLLIG